jgi:hypothetical protein
MKRFAILLMILVVATTFLPAQDTIELPGDGTHVINPIDEFPSDGNVLDWFNWAVDSWERVFALLFFLLGALEVVFRAIPTKGDYSVFTNIARFLDRIRLFKIFPFKNKTVDAGRFVARSEKLDK